MKILLDVHTNDEYADDVPSKAEVELDRNLIKRILHLSAVVRKEKLYCTEEWNYQPDYKQGDLEDGDGLEDWEGGKDSERLHVTDDGFMWSFYIKNTNIECTTDTVSIKELREYYKVLTMKKEKLPTLMGYLEHDMSKKLLQERMKNG